MRGTCAHMRGILDPIAARHRPLSPADRRLPCYNYIACAPRARAHLQPSIVPKNWVKKKRRIRLRLPLRFARWGITDGLHFITGRAETLAQRWKIKHPMLQTPVLHQQRLASACICVLAYLRPCLPGECSCAGHHGCFFLHEGGWVDPERPARSAAGRPG